MLHPIHFESPIDRYHLEFPSEVAPRIVPPSVPVAALEGLEGRSRAAFLSAACERIASPMRPPIDPPPWLVLERRSSSFLVGISRPGLGRLGPCPLSRTAQIRLGRAPARRRHSRPRAARALGRTGPVL